MADDLIVEIGGDPSGLNDAIRRAETAIRSFQDRMQKIGDSLTSLGSTLSASITLPIVGLGTAAVKAYGDIQALQKGLEAVAGSAAEANRQFNELKEVSKLPGLGLKEAVKGSINLQSIGISANNAKNILLQFGNAIATVGKGREEFERAIYGVQQLANTDFPLGEDLNIIKDALPQVSNLLKEAFGTSRSDDLAKMGISSKQILDTIVGGLGKLPRVSGGVKNAFENLSDSINISLGRIGKIIDDNLDISGLIDRVTGYIDKLITEFEGLDPTIQKVIIGVAGLAAAAGPLLLATGALVSSIPVITAGLGAIGTLFAGLLSPIGLVTVAVAGVAAAFVANWDKIRPYLEENIDRFKRLYNESVVFRTVIGTFGAYFDSGFKAAGVVLSTFYNNLKKIGKGVLEIFSSIGQVIEGTLTLDFDKIAQGVKRGFSSIGDAVTGVALNGIKGFAELNNLASTSVDKFKQLRFDLSKGTNLSLPISFGINSDEVDKTVSGIDKVKESLKKLKEVFPVGSEGFYEAEIQRLEALKKRAVIGSEAWSKLNEQILKYKEILNPSEIQPIKLESKGFIDEFGKEFKTAVDYIASQAARANQILNTELPTIVSDSALKMKESVASFNTEASQLLSQGVADTISGAMEAFGYAIATGQNAINAVGQSLLSSIGDIMIKLGKLAITTGISLKGIQIALKSLNPYVAIAAGAALVALGSAVKGSVSNLGDSIGGGSSGGGGNISTATGSSVKTNYSSNYSGGGGGGGEVVFRISGPDLIGAINRNVQAADRLSSI